MEGGREREGRGREGEGGRERGEGERGREGEREGSESYLCQHSLALPSLPILMLYDFAGEFSHCAMKLGVCRIKSLSP